MANERIDAIIERLTALTEAVTATEGSLVDAKLGRGLLWAELTDWSQDAVAEAADRLRVDMSVVKQERWMSAKFPAGNPREWLNWYALRALATFSEDEREDIIGQAEDMDIPTSEEVARLCREAKAAARGAGADSPDADPITATDLDAYLRACLERELTPDFALETIDRIVTVVTRAVGEFERAGAATLASVFGRVPVEAGAEA